MQLSLLPVYTSSLFSEDLSNHSSWASHLLRHLFCDILTYSKRQDLLKLYYIYIYICIWRRVLLFTIMKQTAALVVWFGLELENTRPHLCNGRSTKLPVRWSWPLECAAGCPHLTPNYANCKCASVWESRYKLAESLGSAFCCQCQPDKGWRLEKKASEVNFHQPCRGVPSWPGSDRPFSPGMMRDEPNEKRNCWASFVSSLFTVLWVSTRIIP